MKHHCKWSRKPERAQYSLEVTGKAGVFKDEIERRGPLRRIKAALHQQKHFWALPECQMWLPPIESGSPSTLPTIVWQTLKCLTQKLGSLPESIACSIVLSPDQTNCPFGSKFKRHPKTLGRVKVWTQDLVHANPVLWHWAIALSGMTNLAQQKSVSFKGQLKGVHVPIRGSLFLLSPRMNPVLPPGPADAVVASIRNSRSVSTHCSGWTLMYCPPPTIWLPRFSTSAIPKLFMSPLNSSWLPDLAFQSS